MYKYHILISGKVQGVFFRLYTKKKADELGLSGWVKNLPSRQVKVIILGSQEKIDKMIKWFWHGSPLAKVENVEILNKAGVSRDKFNGKFLIK